MSAKRKPKSVAPARKVADVVDPKASVWTKQSLAGGLTFVGSLGVPLDMPKRQSEFTAKTVNTFTIVPVTRFEIRHSRDADNDVFKMMGPGPAICECESRDEAEKIAEAMAKAA